MDLCRSNVVEDAYFPDTETVLRPRQTAQPLDSAPARLRRFVAEVGFEMASHVSAISRRERLEILKGLGRKKDLIPHSSQSIARLREGWNSPNWSRSNCIDDGGRQRRSG